MTLNISFTSERGPDVPATITEQLEEALAAIGFHRQVQSVPQALRTSTSDVSVLSAGQTEQTETRPTPETLATVAQHVDPPKRERGKPGPGRKRRSAEEVAEDEAAEKAEATAVGAAAETPQISSGEERVGPEDTAEVQAIDAADEAAEADGGEIVEMLTLDDVRTAVGKYQQAYGTPATLADLPLVMRDALGPVPEGTMLADGSGPTDRWRLSILPEDGASLRKVVDGIEAAFTSNRFKRDAVGL